MEARRLSTIFRVEDFTIQDDYHYCFDCLALQDGVLSEFRYIEVLAI